MPVVSGSHASPTRFASGGRLTVAEWGSRPVNAPGAPTILPGIAAHASRCRQCWVRSSRLLRVIVVYSATSRRKRKGEAALPPHA